MQTHHKLGSATGSVCRWLFVSALTAIPVLTAAEPSARIEVDDHRPLASAIDLVEVIAKHPIHYEDPPYQHIDDLEDVTTSAQRADSPGFRLLVPRRGSLVTRVDVELARADPADAALRLIGAYESNGLPGRFRVLRQSGALIVLPTDVKDIQGKRMQVSSPLAPKITLPPSTRTLTETLVRLLEEVTKASGAKVSPGVIPVVQDRKIRFQATREPARDALLRLLGAISPNPVSYRLLYDPVLKAYMLNLQTLSLEQDQPPSTPVDSQTAIPAPSTEPFYTRSPDSP